MPEEQKTVAAPLEATAENGTGTNSPTKSPVSKGKMALAKVTLLDGTVRNYYIDVSLICMALAIRMRNIYNLSNKMINIASVAEKSERTRTS